MRKLPAILAAAAVVAASTHPTLAQTYPSETIRIVVPFSPGGAADVASRLFGSALQDELGSPVIVENRPGGGGVVGTSEVANANPDGYTLLFASTTAMSTAPVLQSDLAYDPTDSFRPISLFVSVPTILVTTKAMDELGSIEGLRDYVHAHPGNINYGSLAIGSTQHLAAILYEDAIDGEMTNIPYRGQDTLIPDLVNGIIQVAFTNITSALSQVRARELNALAVALDKRWPTLPDVPTFEEAGLPSMRVSSWLGLFAPAGTPDDVVAALDAAIENVMASPELEKKLYDIGVQPVGSTSAELADFHAQDRRLWTSAVELYEAKQ